MWVGGGWTMWALVVAIAEGWENVTGRKTTRCPPTHTIGIHPSQQNAPCLVPRVSRDNSVALLLLFTLQMLNRLDSNSKAELAALNVKRSFHQTDLFWCVPVLCYGSTH